MNRYIKEALFGAIGGVAGTFVILKVMGAISQLQSEADRNREKALVPEPPTEKLARRLSENIGVALNPQNKAAMGKAVQWGYGIFWGGVYGILRHRVPALSRGAGLPFGVAFGLFGPAVVLPLTGLTPPAHQFPISAHGRGLVSHYAYAATVEGVCRACEAIDRAVTRKPERTKPELRRVS